MVILAHIAILRSLQMTLLIDTCAIRVANQAFGSPKITYLQHVGHVIRNAEHVSAPMNTTVSPAQMTYCMIFHPLVRLASTLVVMES